MAVPDVQSLVLPALCAIAAVGEIGSADLRQQIATEFRLSESDLAEMLSGGVQTAFTNRVSWVLVSLQNSGLIEKAGRKRYRVTSAGLQALRAGESKIRFQSAPLRGVVLSSDSDAWSDGGMVPATALVAEITPEDQIEKSYAVQSAALAAGLLDRVREMPPPLFERLTIELLIKLGYGGGYLTRGEAVGRSGDGGIDGVIKEDALGLDRIYVQAKRYAADNRIGRPEVQAFIGSLEMRHATKGVFITTSSFSQAAHDVITQVTKRIILIDGSLLAKLMVERGVGVRTVRTYELKSIDENYFEESSIS